MKKLLIGVNLFGECRRQNIARDSWIHLQHKYPDKIEFNAIQFKWERDTFIDCGITPKFVLERSSKDIVLGGTKELPILRDILEYLAMVIDGEDEYSHFGWINSDIITTNILLDYLMNNDINALAVSRLDIKDANSFVDITNNGIQVIRNELAGFDAILVSKEWWQKNRNLIGHYAIAVPNFDQIIAGIIAVTGGEIYNNPQLPMICHIQHPIKWGADSPEKQWNINLMKNNPFDHLCFNMMHYHLQKNLALRKPWGAFMIPQPGEKEFTQEFFDIFSLETPNQIKYVQ